MKKRPLSITIISWLFLAAGVIGLAHQATEFKAQRPFEYGLVFVCLVRLRDYLRGVHAPRGQLGSLASGDLDRLPRDLERVSLTV